MKSVFLKTSLAILFLAFMAPASFSDDSQSGPTPYPSKDSDWPGKGVIRKFNWMDGNRAAFWKGREAGQGSIVFAGDSLTGGWKEIGKAFPDLKVANRGIGGDTSRGLLFRFKEDVLDLNPKAIVINIGTNDLTALGKVDDSLSNISEMLAMAAAQCPKAPIVLCKVPPSENPKAPIKPSEKKALNDGVERLASGRKGVYVCDLFAAMSNPDGSQRVECFVADRLHLSSEGYARWTEAIRPLFEKAGLLNGAAR